MRRRRSDTPGGIPADRTVVEVAFTDDELKALIAAGEHTTRVLGVEPTTPLGRALAVARLCLARSVRADVSASMADHPAGR